MTALPRVAIVGAQGQLGVDLVKVAGTHGWEPVPLTHADADVTDPAAAAAAIHAARPAAVVNCASFTAVDRAEDEPAAAFLVNAVGALHVARAARQAGAALVHVSTDYVFDGEKSPPRDGRALSTTSYLELDVPGPLSVYGASKAAGEHLARQGHPDALVVRIASVFGAAGARGKGGNFLETILRKAKDGRPFGVVSDQWMTPTYTVDAAGAILDLVKGGQTGVVHVTNRGACTWHAFASKALELARIPLVLEAIPAASYPTKARRPANSALNTDLLAKVRGQPLRPWPQALEAYLREKGHL